MTPRTPPRLLTDEQKALLWRFVDTGAQRPGILEAVQAALNNHDTLSAALAEAQQQKWFKNCQRMWDAIIPHGPRCRDCADADGTCPHSGLPCDPTDAAIELVKRLRESLTEAERAREEAQQTIVQQQAVYADTASELLGAERVQKECRHGLVVDGATCWHCGKVQRAVPEAVGPSQLSAENARLRAALEDMQHIVVRASTIVEARQAIIGEGRAALRGERGTE